MLSKIWIFLFVKIYLQLYKQNIIYMKRILILFFAIATVAVAFAQEQTKEWSMQTNTGVSIKMTEVDYLLAADDANLFSVVMKNGNRVDGVSRVTFSDASAVTDIVADNGLSLFPNPVRNTLTLTGATIGSEVYILSLDGAVVKSVVVTENSTTIDVATLPQGMYLLKSAYSTVKFVKK